MRHRLMSLIVLVSLLIPAWAQSEGALLHPDQAFIPTAQYIDPHNLNIHFQIAPGYYLYRDRMHADYHEQNLPIQFPVAEQKVDPNVGVVPVYHREVSLRVCKKSRFLSGEGISLTWQGCSEQGVCYAPQTTRFVVGEKSRVTVVQAHDFLPATPKEWLGAVSYQSYFSGAVWTSMLFFYLAGLGLALTACMYPLIPIVSNLIVGKANTAYRPTFFLSFIYVQSMAMMYAGAGVLAALSGELFIVYLQQSWVLISLAVFFVFMALSMLGVFQLQVPSPLQSWLIHKTQYLPRGRYISAALLGMVSSLIIGPCIAPPLAAVLAYIGKEGNLFLGACSLYMLALGMGTPLLLIGMLGQQILPRLHPKIMQMMQGILGFILLGTALWIAMPVLSVFWLMLLLGMLLIVAGGSVGWQIRKMAGYDIARVCLFILTLFLLLGGAMQWIGAMTGSRDILRPLAVLLGEPPLRSLPTIRVTSVKSLQQQLILQRGKIVMLEFCADWCVSCKEMERWTFQDPKAQAIMKKGVWLKADVTQNNRDDQHLLRAFGLYGPPGILFFNQQGHILSTRVIGYQNAEAFLQTLSAIEWAPRP